MQNNYNTKSIMGNILKFSKRGLANGTHKIHTPRLLRIFLRSVISSDKLYGKYKDKKDAKRLDEYTCKLIYCEGDKKKFIKSKELRLNGYFITLEGYLSMLGLDLLLFFLDEAKRKKTKTLEFTAYDLIKTLNLPYSGLTFDSIFKQVKRLTKIGIVISKDLITDLDIERNVKSEMEFIYLLKADQTTTTNEKIKEANIYKIKIILSSTLFKSLQNFNTLVDWKVYKSIKKPSDRLFYLLVRLLDYGKKETYIKINEVFEALNIVRDNHYKRKLSQLMNCTKKYSLQSVNFETDYKKGTLKINYTRLLK